MEIQFLKLDILVENMGRVNYGRELRDQKGATGICFGNQFHFGWDLYALPMDDLTKLNFQPAGAPLEGPAFLRGELNIEGVPCDTFLRLDGFTKGFVVVNGFNLGRYFNPAGPQKTLYLPAPLLHEGDNEIIVFESDGYETPVIQFLAEADLGSTRPAEY